VDVPTPAPALDLALLDELPLGLWIARAPDGQVVLANRAFRRIMGMDAVPGARIEDTPAIYGIVDRQGRPYPVERLPFSRAVATGQVAVAEAACGRSRRRSAARKGGSRTSP
jgi:PAS domain-containing protein